MKTLTRTFSRTLSRTFPRVPYWLMAGSMTAMALAPAAQASETSRLSVNAKAHIEVVPDRATLNARLWEETPAIERLAEEEDAALSEARARLETRASELITTLESQGIERDAISAGSLNIYPRQIHNRNEDGNGETLKRTRLERPIEVQLDDIEQVSAILDALISAGVNQLDGVEFDLKDRDAVTDEALIKALEKARHKADLMANTLDAELGKVHHIQETQSPMYQPRMMAVSAELNDAAGSTAPQAEYRPGTIRIDAEVSVEWLLKD